MRALSTVLFALILSASSSVSAQESASKERVIAEIDKVIISTAGSSDPEVVAAFGVLMTLSASLSLGRTQQFFNNAVVPYAEQEVERIKGMIEGLKEEEEKGI